jgi:2-phosphosulfolactate phosphatase
MAAALEAGAEAIAVFSDLDTLTQASESWPVEKRIRAGERGGAQVEGFELGNSPLALTHDMMAGRRLFMSTTNGTRCLTRIQNAPWVMAASLTTRRAVVKRLVEKQPGTVWLVGSGWEGSYSLEDTVCAGAIVHEMLAQTGLAAKEIAGNDAAIAAMSLYLQWHDQLLNLLQMADHGQRLLRLKNEEDLAYCAQLDVLEAVPVQASPGVLVKG